MSPPGSAGGLRWFRMHLDENSARRPGSLISRGTSHCEICEWSLAWCVLTTLERNVPGQQGASCHRINKFVPTCGAQRNPQLHTFSVIFHPSLPAHDSDTDTQTPPPQLSGWNDRRTDGLTLSSERLAAEVYGEEETGYLETHTHLIEILKCIVDKKT